MSYIVLRDGRKVEITEIDTHAEAVDALAFLDESIISIEEQVDRARQTGDVESDWIIKARTALKHKRRARSPLQERIGHLRRQEKAVAQTVIQQASADRHATWHRAFVTAVRESVTGAEFERLSKQADEAAERAL